ncbi:hypothetical protein Moror_10422 [Moniliophthora roreri MCA 2997]|uniref:Uncharacterized protein n=1 Tax=Moniliophthora roreri (strain MCA 2997) TaxID=1381753 RepID=V2XHC8_MONRO|nr:hypothetical protein Moror_10422 [Moniliophthora roreri MCA 2997]
MSARHESKRHITLQPLKPLYLVERYFGHSDSIKDENSSSPTSVTQHKENRSTPKIIPRSRISNRIIKPPVSQSAVPNYSSRAPVTSKASLESRYTSTRKPRTSTDSADVRGTIAIKPHPSLSASSLKGGLSNGSSRDSFSSNQALPTIEPKAIRNFRKTSLSTTRRAQSPLVKSFTTSRNIIESRILSEATSQDPSTNVEVQKLSDAKEDITKHDSKPIKSDVPQLSPSPSSRFKTIDTKFGPCRVRQTVLPLEECANTRIQLELKALRSQKIVQCGGRREDHGQKKISLLGLGILEKHSQL